MSLRLGLRLAAVYVLTLAVTGLEVPLAISLAHRANTEFEVRLLSQTLLVAARINDDVAQTDGEGGPAPRPLAFIQRIASDTARALPGTRFLVVDEQGRVLADSAGEAVVGELYLSPERPELASAIHGVPGGQIDVRRRFSQTLGEELLMVTAPVVHNHQAIGAVRASQPLGALTSRIRRQWLGFAGIGLIVILVGVVVASVLANTLVRPVVRLEEAALKLGRGDLDARADPRGPKEIATLARSFNQMAAALEANIAAQREFLANASHQLRTPLTGLKLRLEGIEQEGGETGEEARKAIAEVDRLNELVEGLLRLARARSVESTASAVDLGEAAVAAADRWTAPAASAGKEVRLDTNRAIAWANPSDVEHVLDNLIENAIRYTPPATTITVAAEERDGSAVLRVSDSGPGIPAADRPRVFDRFYRGSNGRQAGPGTGLGLAIVAELVRRWGGEISLTDRDGTCFEARFPRAAQQAAPARSRPAP